MTPEITGLPWYRSVEHYAQVRAVCADSESFHDTYQEWLRHAEQIEQFIRAQGQTPLRVYLDAADFTKWCHDRSLNVDGQARAAFASEVAGRELLSRREN